MNISEGLPKDEGSSNVPEKGCQRIEEAQMFLRVAKG
jgi:hypothetical protein